MKSILDEAQEIIQGDREKTYGNPGKNLRAIASLWEMHLHNRGVLAEESEGITATDVALMMILLKVARLENDPMHRDSKVDIAGYVALLDRIQTT